MNKVLTLTGYKNCGKYNLAMDLAKNSDIEFIKPYTDKEIPLDDLPEKFGDFHYVSKDTLDMMIEDDEVLSSTMINGDLGYVAENSVPKGIEVTNAKGQTIAMAKEALKVDNNYFYASTGGFQQTLKGTEELDLLKFKLEYEKDSHTKMSGEITVLKSVVIIKIRLVNF